MQKPFIELYRPQTLDDVVGNRQTVERLKLFAQNGNLPNLLFSSPPGMGKTTLALCLGNQLLGDQFKKAFMELNASDERNVTDIRDKVKTFAQLQITLPAGRHKIVFLDECDSMTSQAQLALRRIMEDFADSTRFILACNIVAKVVEPLQSRCCVITLQQPSCDEIASRLQQICNKAGIDGSRECLKLIAGLADGDVRAAVNNLQTCAFTLEKKLTEIGIKNTLDFIDVNQIDKIFAETQNSIDVAWKRVQELFANGFSADELVNAFYRYGMDPASKLIDQNRARFLKVVAQTHARIASGISSHIQVGRMLSELAEIKG